MFIFLQGFKSLHGRENVVKMLFLKLIILSKYLSICSGVAKVGVVLKLAWDWPKKWGEKNKQCIHLQNVQEDRTFLTPPSLSSFHLYCWCFSIVETSPLTSEQPQTSPACPHFTPFRSTASSSWSKDLLFLLWSQTVTSDLRQKVRCVKAAEPLWAEASQGAKQQQKQHSV